MEYPNDRKLLVLLGYIEVLNCKQTRLYNKLSSIYTDNSFYIKAIQDELVQLKYLSVTYNLTDSGAVIEESILYKITPSGIDAVLSGRFPSELWSRKVEKRNLWIGWSATIIGTIGGILGILSALNVL